MISTLTSSRSPGGGEVRDSEKRMQAPEDLWECTVNVSTHSITARPCCGRPAHHPRLREGGRNLSISPGVKV